MKNAAWWPVSHRCYPSWFLVAGLLRRAGRGEVGTAWLDRRLKLHQLGARAIGIVNIQLPLAVQSDLRRAMLRGQAVSGIEQVDRLLHVENPQREVVKHTKGVLRHGGGNAPGLRPHVYHI